MKNEALERLGLIKKFQSIGCPIAEIKEVHVRRRIERAKRAIEIQRRKLEGNRQALRKHYLEDIAGCDMLLGFQDCLNELLASHIRAKLNRFPIRMWIGPE